MQTERTRDTHTECSEDERPMQRRWETPIQTEKKRDGWRETKREGGRMSYSVAPSERGEEGERKTGGGGGNREEGRGSMQETDYPSRQLNRESVGI